MLIKNILTSQPKVGNVRFIAIDGHGGSGKTTLARIIADRLDAQIVHTDDFASWDNPKDWWPLVIERVFEPIKNNASILIYPKTNWWSDGEDDSSLVEQPVTDVMILEGVSSLRKEFREYISYGIFVDTPLDVCIQRGIMREGHISGKSRKELLDMWVKESEGEKLYMKRDDPRGYADAVLDGAKILDTKL